MGAWRMSQRRPLSPSERVAARSITPRPDCLIWVGAVDRGYGRISVDGVVKRVHRVTWEAANGPIPDDLVLDHLCGIKQCVNVEHMELVTQAENSARGTRAFTGRLRQVVKRRRRPGLCAKGHSLADAIYAPSDPEYARCRTCETARTARRAARSSAGTNAPNSETGAGGG